MRLDTDDVVAEAGLGGAREGHEPMSTEWETPDSLFCRLNEEFGFTVDVCARAENAKSDRFWTPEDDGLGQLWDDEICWMNPPWGQAIQEWLKKAVHECRNGADRVVALLPARTDTRWWHRYVMLADEVRLMRGRPWFRLNGESAGRSRLPCVIVAFSGLVSKEHEPFFTSWPEERPELGTWDWR